MKGWEKEAIECYDAGLPDDACELLLDNGVDEEDIEKYLQKLRMEQKLKVWEIQAIEYDKDGKDYSAHQLLISHGVPEQEVSNYINSIKNKILKPFEQEALKYEFSGQHGSAIMIIRDHTYCKTLEAETRLAELVALHNSSAEKLPDDPLERLTMTLEKLIKLERRK